MPLPKERIHTIEDICEVFPAPFAVFLQAEDEKNKTNYLEPDISVICDKNKLDSKGCNGAPDWIIEIVSPSSSSKCIWRHVNTDYQYPVAHDKPL